MYLDGIFGRTASSNNKEYLFFSGYDYLAVHTVPAFRQLVETGMHRYGWLYPSARISNTPLRLYEECENRLSEFTGQEETVLFPSGFNAGQAATALFAADLHNSPFSHPAIRQHAPEVNVFARWGSWCLQQKPGNKDNRPAFASDTLNNLEVKLYDFSFLQKLDFAATIVLDDSHGIGITGKEGRGVVSRLPQQPLANYVVTYSMGKAFGIQAGAVSCTHETALALRKDPAFTAVTPPSPGELYAFLHGQDIYRRQQQKLRDNIRFMGELAKGLPGILTHPEIPVVLLPSRLKEADFLEAGIMISSFAYPDPQGERLNRLVINAAHTQEDLERVIKFIRQKL